MRGSRLKTTKTMHYHPGYHVMLQLHNFTEVRIRILRIPSLWSKNTRLRRLVWHGSLEKIQSRSGKLVFFLIVWRNAFSYVQSMLLCMYLRIQTSQGCKDFYWCRLNPTLINILMEISLKSRIIISLLNFLVIEFLSSLLPLKRIIRIRRLEILTPPSALNRFQNKGFKIFLPNC